MAENQTTKTAGHGGGIALFLTLLLLGAIAWCCWLIWSEQQRLAAMDQKEQVAIEALRKQRDDLKNLTELSPCDLKAALIKAGLTSELPAEAPAAPQGTAPVAASPDMVESGCVFIVSADAAKKLGTGSGFFVAPEYIVTNKHVVGNAVGKILVTSKALGKPVVAKVVALGDGNEDYALLKIDLPANARTTVLSFAPDVKKTDKVGTWGFPYLVGKNDPKYVRLLKGEDLSAVPELSYSEGVVSAVLERKPRVIVHTAPISPGNSGGPLLDQNGHVVGINSMITLDDDSYRQASLALAAGDLEQFLGAAGVEPVRAR